jgi:hypothetical protein
MGGAVSSVTNAVGDVASGVGDVVSGGVNVASDMLKPALAVGKWSWENPVEAAALAAGGYYFAPEMAAWVNPATGEAVAGSAAGTAAGAAPEALSGLDLGGAGASPASWGAGGGAGAGAAGASMLSGMGQYATPLAIAGSSLLGANAAKSAANTQANAQNQANQLQYKMFQEQQALQEPWRQTGINALAKLNSGDMSAMMDPGYAFRLSEGQKALDRQAAARGGLISGGALKAATKYGQDMGSQEYTNAFNRYATLAGYGQNATNNLTSAAGNAGANIGAGITSAGAANAAGSVGAANALASGVGQYLNYSSNQDLTNAIRQSAYTKAA